MLFANMQIKQMETSSLHFTILSMTQLSQILHIIGFYKLNIYQRTPQHETVIIYQITYFYYG